MKFKKIGILAIFVALILLFGFLIISGLGKKAVASLEVDANVSLPVYVNGNNVGQTPFVGIFEPGETSVKVGNYETEVNLSPQVKTIVKRNFSKNMDTSGGEIATLIRTGGNSAMLTVLTNPDGANISLDGKVLGVTPVNTDSPSGNHQIKVQKDGYTTADMSVNLLAGYKLVAIFDISQIAPVVQKNLAIQNNANEVMVQILSTPNGFLRVRSEPTSASNEITEVHPGEEYKLLNEDLKAGWYEIELNASSSAEATTSGWISSIYAATISANLK